MRILLASDGSRDSRRAARWLRDFPLPSDTALCVLTVATLTQPPSQSETMNEVRDTVRAQARQAGERARKILTRRWSEVEVVVTEGDPRVEIVRVAEERRADMIALGARGLGAVRGFLLGSVSLTVARYASCPVLIARGRPRQVRRTLVAVDGSEGSREALRFLSIFGLVREASVRLVHVVQEIPAPSGFRRFITSQTEEQLAQEQRKQRADADEMLARAVAELGGAAGRVEQSVVPGTPAKEIAKMARSSDVDLVVVGARGVGAIERLLLGSVSETVVHHAKCPVVIVRRR